MPRRFDWRGMGTVGASGWGWGAAVILTACAHVKPVPPVGQVTVDRSRPPELGPPPNLVLPPVIKRELPNGLRLVIVERHTLPLADFILVARSGTEADPESKPGLGTLTADLLLRGTASRTATELAEQQALLGIEVHTGATWDESVVAMHTPTAQLDSALALFADVALHPAFASPELDRARHERLTRLVLLQDRGPFVADRAFAAILFGTAHPYGRPPLGTESSIEAITRADVAQFYKVAFRPGNSTLIAVGDVRPEDVERRARVLFGAWAPAIGGRVIAAGARPAAATRPRTDGAAATPDSTAATTAIYLIDKPGAPQSSVRVGSVGVSRDTPDYFALTVLNTTLGGSFTSRLNQDLREAHGYTYGAFSRFEMRREPGAFVASAEVVASKTDSSLVEVMRQIRAIADTIPVDELNRTKRYLELELPGKFETTTRIAEQLVPVVVYGLPDDFYNTYQARVARVTQADAYRAARRYIDPGRMIAVIVGDRKSIEAPLRAAGIGPVQGLESGPWQGAAAQR